LLLVRQALVVRASHALQRATEALGRLPLFALFVP
jgi:hypothetical protein